MTVDAELGAVLALVALPDLGPRRFRALVGERTAAETVDLLRRRCWGDLPVELSACQGVGLEILERWASGVGDVDPDALVKYHLERGVQVLGPRELRGSEPWVSDPEPPAVLFQQGAPVEIGDPRVAIIGTRRCTAYGRAVARNLGCDLARAGITVVSGVAAGIDGVAQLAALDAGGRVVGVVGTGLDRVYPRVNAGLWHRLAVEGTLISEYPLGTGAARWRFPARNRLIAALSDAVVVVESPERGGSMYTVEAALERDREVLVIPGPVTSPTSDGPNRLLVEGATPVRDVADVMAALGHCSPTPLTGDAPTRTAAQQSAHEHQWLLDALGWEAATVDELMLRTVGGLTRLSMALSRLQADGLVDETGGWWERRR